MSDYDVPMTPARFRRLYHRCRELQQQILLLQRNQNALIAAFQEVHPKLIVVLEDD